MAIDNTGAGAGPATGGSTSTGSSAPTGPGGFESATAPITGPSTSQPIDLSDDTPIRWPGEANPVKYGELHKRLQADHTRKTQAAAKLQKQLAAERAAFQAETAAERKRLENLAAQLAGRGNQSQQGGQAAWLQELSKKEYITGQDMAALMGAVQNQGFGAVAKAIEQRDQVLTAMYQLVQRQQKVLNSLQGRHTETEFESKITNFIKQLDRDPEEYREYAKELYLAYEGDDLDDEFPEILRRRLEQLERAAEKARSRKVEAARRPAFPIPGKGGAGAPGKAAGLTGRENSVEKADKLWQILQGTSE